MRVEERPIVLGSYGIDPWATDVVNENVIWILPTMNPDGLEHVWTADNLWRKNRRDNGDGSFGVDLNRNWGFAWGWDNIGSDPDPSGETYRAISR